MAGPALDLLLRRHSDEGSGAVDVTVVGASDQELQRLVGRFPSTHTTTSRLRARALDVAAMGEGELRALIRDGGDVVLSLLPAPLHPRVARACLAEGRHLVTSSYVSPELAAMDAEAKARGVVLLNEAGLDPGCVG